MSIVVTTGEPQFHLSERAGAAVGLGFAVVLLSPLLLLSKATGMQFMAVQLGFIGGVYAGFGIANGQVRAVLVEFFVGGSFFFVGAFALWLDSPILLAAGYAAHAAWDAAHHPRAISMPVKTWYPPFCVVLDVVFAAFILAWLPLHGVA